MRLRLWSILAAAVLSVSTMSAVTPRQKIIDEANNSHRPVYFGQGDDLTPGQRTELIRQFYESQFRQFNDPLAPYFMMMHRDGKLAMGVGGVFALRERYDWHGVQDNYDFIPYRISPTVDPTGRHGFGTSVAGTRIFATVIGHTDRFGYFKVYVEGKFASNRNFELGKAYATLADWTAGYASSTFSDVAAQPTTVDDQGPNSFINNTNILVRWTHTIRSHYVLAASLETPSTMVPSTSSYTGCKDYMPSFVAFAQYQWEGVHQHVRLSGIVRGLEYRNLVAGRNRRTIGWGAQLSTVFNPIPSLTVYGMVHGGRGISDMVNDLQQAPLDLMPGTDTPDGTLYAPAEFGWYAALQYAWNSRMYSTLIFSQERLLPRHTASLTGDTYRYGYYATANLFYHPLPRATFGIEYNWGYRKDNNLARGHQNRVQVMFQFDF